MLLHELGQDILDIQKPDFLLSAMSGEAQIGTEMKSIDDSTMEHLCSGIMEDITNILKYCLYRATSLSSISHFSYCYSSPPVKLLFQAASFAKGTLIKRQNFKKLGTKLVNKPSKFETKILDCEKNFKIGFKSLNWVRF